MAQLDYRPYIPGPAETRIAGGTAEEHTAERLKAPRPRQLFDEWAALADRPFRGIADGGGKREGLFALQPEDAPVEAMAAAAGRLHDRLSPEERARTRHPVGSPLWHRWQNTEMLVEEHGLRLEHAAPPGPRTGHGGGARQHERGRLRGERRRHAPQRLSGRCAGRAGGAQRMELHVLPVRRAIDRRSLGLAALRPPSVAELPDLGGQMVRTPNGNDYGIDLLRQHYSRSHAGGGTPGHADDRG